MAAASMWYRPPRLILPVFALVAVVSVLALGWLAWLLLEQDTVLEARRQQVLLEEAADGAVAATRDALARLDSALAEGDHPSARLPEGVHRMIVAPDGIVAPGCPALLYQPVARQARATAPSAFAEGQRLEFLVRDLAAAATLYAASAATKDDAIRAGALARLARVHRQRGDVTRALRAYDALQTIERVDVDGLPSGLVARVGRATVLEQAGRPDELAAEAARLSADLARGRWALTKSEYEYYASLASTWGAPAPAVDRATAACTEIVNWLWENRDTEARLHTRATAGGLYYIVTHRSSAGLSALAAGPPFIAGAVGASLRPGQAWALTDVDGRAMLGTSPPPEVMTAQRSAGRLGLAATLQVFPDPASTPAGVSPRRRLLIAVLAMVGLVLVGGWYVIARAVSRELRVSRLQSDFVAAVSHEFRSPLTSMAHIAELLAEGRLPDDLRRRSYDVLLRDTERLRRLVEGLLDFGRFEAGAAALSLEPVDVADIVRATVADFQLKVKGEGYHVALIDDGSPVVTAADREALSVALWNLLDNAVKYSPECRTIWVEIRRTRNSAEIVVRDRGLGIPAHEQREIFDRFVRGADAKTRRIRGAGLGLALVRHIVQAHGGELRLTSRPGLGSDFTLVLPTARGAA